MPVTCSCVQYISLLGKARMLDLPEEFHTVLLPWQGTFKLTPAKRPFLVTTVTSILRMKRTNNAFWNISILKDALKCEQCEKAFKTRSTLKFIWLATEVKSQKNSGLNGIRTLCDTGAMLYQLSCVHWTGMINHVMSYVFGSSNIWSFVCLFALHSFFYKNV